MYIHARISVRLYHVSVYMLVNASVRVVCVCVSVSLQVCVLCTSWVVRVCVCLNACSVRFTLSFAINDIYSLNSYSCCN